jgi:hypothetical protein
MAPVRRSPVFEKSNTAAEEAITEKYPFIDQAQARE